MDNIILLFDSNRGVYIPQNWAEDCADLWGGYDPEDVEILKAGPDHEWYWEAWNSVMQSAEITIEGKTYSLHQDGDCWAIAYDDLTDDEHAEFFGECF